jgi:hypothetical protein
MAWNPQYFVGYDILSNAKYQELLAANQIDTRKIYLISDIAVPFTNTEKTTLDNSATDLAEIKLILQELQTYISNLNMRLEDRLNGL